mgnify:CR=1 FL=1
MKKNYTLKLVLAMLIVVLVSLVSFVGVYKGKNLLKDYSLGKDFEQRKVATFSVVEKAAESVETTTEQSSEEKTEILYFLIRASNSFSLMQSYFTSLSDITCKYSYYGTNHSNC